jgi:ATP-dependent Zn protease
MLEEQIMIALAGALAEEVVLGARSTGSAGDYEQSLRLVEKMLASGMSELGVVDVSKLSADQRQSVTHDILINLEQRTQQIITEGKAVLFQITDILQEEESISGEKLRSYLNTVA